MSDPQWVPANPVRAHAVHLLDATRLPWRALPLHTAMPTPAIRTLLFGRPGYRASTVWRPVAEALLRVTPRELWRLGNTPISAGRTRSRLTILREAGLDPYELLGELQASVPELRAVDAGVRVCTAKLDLLARVACEKRHLTNDDDQLDEDGPNVLALAAA